MASDLRHGRRRGVTAAVLAVGVAGMVGLAFASVPLYRLFCQVTGYGGTPRTGVASGSAAPAEAGFVTVRLDANVNGGLPWEFRPVAAALRVPLGESTLTHFTARNLSNETVTGTATFNVTPFKAAPHFVKVQCFCFDEQTLGPGETADMPVTFYVDPDILKDAADVDTITLSYTFFRAPARPGAGAKPAAAVAAPAAGAGRS